MKTCGWIRRGVPGDSRESPAPRDGHRPGRRHPGGQPPERRGPLAGGAHGLGDARPLATLKEVNGVFRDVPWYAGNRDLPEAPYAATHLYRDLEELRDRHAEAVRAADLVVLGSFVPDGPVVARWVLATATGKTAFYDIDTPATLAALEGDGCAYLDRAAKIGRAHV